jgi:large subunit ribosomal protein L19
MSLIQNIEKKHIQKLANNIAKEEGKEEINKEKYNEFCNRLENINIGDLVKVHYKIVEGKRHRIQIFEGYIISIKGKALTRTFKVRKISYGVGVERTFPVYSPNITKIELIRKSQIRRSKLYYLRKRKGKKAVLKEKIIKKK